MNIKSGTGLSGTDDKALWIWYPGDFEIWQHMKLSLRREDREIPYPPFWRLETCFPSVQFRIQVHFEKEERISIHADGVYLVMLDGMVLLENGEITIPEGGHTIIVKTANETGLPSIFIDSEVLKTGAAWEASACDGNWLPAGFWNLDDINTPPSLFKLPVKEIAPEKVTKTSRGILADFGKETFAGLKLSGISGKGGISIYYGESEEEALSTDSCILMEHIGLNGTAISGSTTELKGNTPGLKDNILGLKDNILGLKNNTLLLKTRAFRFVCMVPEQGVEIGGISALYEYLPLEYRGSFCCADDTLNRIWDTAAYTLHLNTREFFLDGIKRDRWVWCGDAYQSFLMNFYIFFDEAVNRRTLIALRGKDPVATHINTIMDYSFYWFMGIYDHYLYTGDVEFLKSLYSKMLTLMDFCLGRRNSGGMMEGLPGDWVFVDWADMEKKGEVCTEQLLLCRSLEIMSACCSMLGEKEKAEEYGRTAGELREQILKTFWDPDQGALVSSRIGGKLCRQVTKHPNIFAAMFGYLSSSQLDEVITRVIMNDEIPKIKTPYFRFYELAFLCEAGKHEYVLKEILDYWGGMLRLGATTFWEEYDPAASGADHYRMYGRPFGKSLCHAWGASPIYLLGKYYLGVKPLTPGYETYEISPNTGGLAWIEGTVPLPGGTVRVYMDSSAIKVESTWGTGYLRFRNASAPVCPDVQVRCIEGCLYEVVIKPGREYVIYLQ